MSDLTKNEWIIMLAVWRLKEEAYGVIIKKQIQELTGKEWNYGTLYGALDQLVQKGLLIKAEGLPMPERGGRRKIFYTISREGDEALESELTLQKTLWAGFSPALGEGMV